MEFVKCFIVLVVLIGRLCLCKIMIDVQKSEKSVEIEEAVNNILITCYADQDKTVVLLGDFPGKLISRLSCHQYFSLVLINDNLRGKNIIRDTRGTDLNRKHKVNIAIATASYHIRMAKMLTVFSMTPYYNSMASILILGWSPQSKSPICDGGLRTFTFIANLKPQVLLKLKILCRHRSAGITIYNSNPFTNQIPKPWNLAGSGRYQRYGPSLSILFQKYLKNLTCENLDFDKTRNWGGTPIKFLFYENGPRTWVEAMNSTERLLNIKMSNEPQRRMERRELIEFVKDFSYFNTFLKIVNGTQMIVWERLSVGRRKTDNNDAVDMRPILLSGVQKAYRCYAYPFRRDCSFLVSQFRGHKSQLQKIIDIIDIYSWISLCTVYIITLIFFLYFLGQTLLEGILDLVRLTSNSGINILPINLASRIYLSCLLFLVVTMQGIFVGNLAALLTQNIPVRQINTLNDLVDFRYSIYVHNFNLPDVEHTVAKNYIIESLHDDDCFPYVEQDNFAACVFWGAGSPRERALSLNLYVSKNCFTQDYYSNLLPVSWALEERLNEIMSIMFAASILTPLDTMVNEKRLIEAENQENIFEPKVMTLRDLSFTFIILAVGESIAFITFISEKLFYHIQHRDKTTRVIVLK